LHGKGIKKEAKSWIKKIMYKFSFWNSYIETLSKKLNYDVEDVYKGTLYSIFNGIVDEENIYKMYSTESDKTISLLFLSNLVKNKGILDFVESIKILRERKLVFKAYIVGAEADINTKELNKIIADLALEQTLIYLGPKYGIEKKKILKDSDIFIFPTMNDCFPIVLLEALQFGLPVISTNEGAITDIVDDEYSGFIVDKKNPKEIADRVEYLINNPEKLREMGRNSRDKYLKEFTLEQFETNLSGIFQEILQRSH
jgi:glycosyltransferase involved in cell wall biosynthesis